MPEPGSETPPILLRATRNITGGLFTESKGNNPFCETPLAHEIKGRKNLFGNAC
jgi:hypothetical protein